MSYKRLAALALAATILIAAGCGSSKSETSTTAAATSAAVPTVSATTSTQTSSPPAHTSTVVIASGKPLTTAQWIAKGDAICGELGQELQTLKVKSAAELPRVLPQAAAYERDEVAELSKLVPPRSKAKDWKQFLTESLQWAEGSAEMGESAKFGDSVVDTPIAQTTFIVHTHLLSIAKRDGFQACAD